MDTYQNTAEDLLRELAQLKSQQRAIDAAIKVAQERLSSHVDNGDLDHLKTDAESTFRFEETNFIYCPGRVSWNYDGCEDVQIAAENLKELQGAAQGAGLATRKQGKPFWSVR